MASLQRRQSRPLPPVEEDFSCPRIAKLAGFFWVSSSAASSSSVRFVNLDSLISGEYAENEFRKDFTVSERVEIGKALEGELGRRNGVRHDTATAKENFPEVKGQTRDLAAKAAGFGNGKTYEQAKTVIDAGAQDLAPDQTLCALAD